MKINRKTVMISMILLILSIIPSPAIADSWDLINIVTGIKYSILEWYDDPFLAIDIAENPQNYIINVNEQLYKVSLVIEKFEEDEEKTIEDVAEELTPEVTVISVDSLEPIFVNQGTPFESVELPKTIILNLSDSTTAETTIKWNDNNYDELIPGEYVLEGIYDLPEGVTGIKPKVEIVVNVIELLSAKYDTIYNALIKKYVVRANLSDSTKIIEKFIIDGVESEVSGVKDGWTIAKTLVDVEPTIVQVIVEGNVITASN